MSEPGYPTVHEDIEIVKTAIRSARAGENILFTDALATAVAHVIKEAGRALSTAYELAGICPPGDYSGLTGKLKRGLLSIDEAK